MEAKTFNENAIRARIAHGGYYPVSDAIDLTTLMDERVTLRARVAMLEAAVTAALVFLGDEEPTIATADALNTQLRAALEK